MIKYTYDLANDITKKAISLTNGLTKNNESQALSALNSQLSAKPGKFQSTWQEQIDSTIDKILNRQTFSYDINNDALYQQYKDQYAKLGKLAMTDAMGQAAALTGGYGSSFGTTAGNQAYQAYLSQLNEVVPELYGMALNRYNQEGEELYNNYALLVDQENQEYNRYLDEYNKWLNEKQIAYNQYMQQKQYEQQLREYNEQVRQYNEQMALKKQQLENSNSSSQSSIENIEELVTRADLLYEADLISEEEYNAFKTAFSGTNEASDSEKHAGTNEVSSSIIQQYTNYKTESGQWDYLSGLINSGVITEEQAFELKDQYGVVDLNNRSWEKVSDGGRNWFGGIDENGKVRDQFGNEYTMEKLYDELKKTMKDSEAKKYVIELQNHLSI